MSEVYKDQIYTPFTAGKKDLTILDVGAHIGIASLYFSQFAKVVYALEPSVEHFDCLTRMIAFNQIKNIKPYCLALYIKEGEYPFFHPPNKTSYSLMNLGVDPSQSETVKTITLDHFFEQEKIDHVDLMKLDVEGSEVEILSHPTFKKVADKIDTILVESHSWNNRHPNQLKEALKNAGFTVENIPNDAQLFVAKRK